VPCLLASDTVNGTELSLAENAIRAPMHPADQFEAFAKLIDDGATVSEIAARFGLSELSVTQRLKLGRLSPVILTAYRDGEIGLDAAQAFAVTDDHEAQERVYEQLSEWSRQPHSIRRALTSGEIPTSDKRVRFVGIDAYIAAGGAIRQDLFSDDDEGYILDAALLDRLVAEKLKTEATTVAAEGWKWVDTATEADYQTLARFAHRQPDRADLSDDAQAELDRLSTEYDGLVEADEPDEETLDDLQQRIDAISETALSWSPETLAMSGALVTLDHDGDLRIERGLVRKEDMPKASERHDTDDAADGEPQLHGPGLSPKLIEDLTAEKSAGIAAELIGRPSVALAAVVHALLLEVFHPGYGTHSCLKLRLQHPGLAFSMAKPDTSKALAALMAEKERLGEWLPGNPADLWTWCMNRRDDELLSLLAFAAGYAVDATRHKSDRADADRLVHADCLARAVTLDMAQWYKPTAEGYFNRIRRAQIMASIDEAKGGHGPALERLKKTELAQRAEAQITGTGWLPEPLRIGEPPVAVNDNRDHLTEAAE
jgi:ParB family chromosome partitioning protein